MNPNDIVCICLPDKLAYNITKIDFSASGMNEPFHELSINKSQRYLINNKCINRNTCDATHQIIVIGEQIFATPSSLETLFAKVFL